MKKVLFVATVTHHINTFHIPYLKMFKENGYEVHVASKGNEKIEFCDKHYDIKFERFPIKSQNIKAYKELKAIISENEYEIIHCHTPVGGVLTRLAAKKARKKGTRVIYTAHGFHFYKGAPKINWLIYYPLEKILSKYTDTLITICKEDFEFAKKKFKKCKSIKHVHGVGFDTERLQINMNLEEKVEYRKNLNIGKDDLVLSYVAELNKNKNQILLINAIKEIKQTIPDIKLLLIGDGILKEYYREVIKKENLENNIQLLGKRKDIGELLSITDIYVASSLREGLPVNIMEAMYMGLPIIAVDNRGHRELVENGVNGYIVKSKEEILSCITMFYGKEIEVNKILIKNKEKAEKYSVETIKNQMKEMYQKIHIKKVIHILNSNKYSGAENVVCTIIENLKEEYEMIYVSPEGAIKKMLNNKEIKYDLVEKLSIYSLVKIVNKHKPEIIHAHDFKASILSSVFSYKKIKIIAHIHKNDDAMKKKSFKSICFRFVTNLFDSIIVVSKSIYDEYIYKESIKDKYKVIYNYINKENVLKNSLKYTIEKEYDLYYIGRLSNEKNPIQFIEIVAEIKKHNNKIRAIMIGDGILYENCKELIKEKSLEANIEMLGFLENPYPYIKASKVGIIPSKYEGFGLVAIEGSILGKKILNSGVGGLKEIYKNNEDLICKETIEYVEKYFNIDQIRFNKIILKNKQEWRNLIIDEYEKK